MVWTNRDDSNTVVRTISIDRVLFPWSVVTNITEGIDGKWLRISAWATLSLWLSSLLLSIAIDSVYIDQQRKRQPNLDQRGPSNQEIGKKTEPWPRWPPSEESIEHSFFCCSAVGQLCELIEGYMVRVLNESFFVLEAGSVCANVVPTLKKYISTTCSSAYSALYES